MSEQLPKPGNYTLQQLFLLSSDGKQAADLIGLLGSVNFLESMDIKGSRGSIKLVDTVGNLIEDLNILGDELVFMEWETPAYKPGKKAVRQFTGRVTGIKNIGYSDNNQGTTLTLSFIDDLAYDQAFNNINLAYKDTLSNIAEKIFMKAKTQPMKDKLAIPKLYADFKKDDTDGIVDIIIPNETPFDSMEFLLGQCYSATNKSCKWYFFQNKDGYNFRSLEDIIKASKDEMKDKKKKEALTYKLDYAQMKETTDNREVAYSIQSIHQFNRVPGFSTYEKGGLKQAVNEVDYIFKRVERTEKQFDINDYTLFDTNLSISEHIMDTYGKESNSTEYIYSDGTRNNQSDLPQSIINKKFMVQYLYSNMVQINIAGNSDISPGILLNLLIQDPAKFGEPGSPMELEPSLSGLFLIKDVNHTFTKEAYAQNVTLTRMGSNAK